MSRRSVLGPCRNREFRLEAAVLLGEEEEEEGHSSAYPLGWVIRGEAQVRVCTSSVTERPRAGWDGCGLTQS